MLEQHILIVDSEDSSRELLAEFLTDSGFDCVAVADEAAAIEAFTRQSFDLVLLDVQGLGEPGKHLLRRMKQGSPGRQIVALSAVADSGARLEAMQLGALDLMPKLITLSDLLQRVRSYLPAAQPSGPAKSATYP